MSDAPALSARGISKAYAGVLANDAVDFDLRKGEIHALLGENGAGKSTLCKILTGLCAPDAGQIRVDGEPLHLHAPGDAYAAGIFMVHQHFSLVERLTVAENVVLGWSPESRIVLRMKEAEREVAETAERFGLSVDPRKSVWQLSVGERQRVEILKALYRGARILILDEPTTVLTPQETDGLFDTLRGLVADGGSVVFISHKLHEVVSVCDRVTVLRQGRTEGTTDLRAESHLEARDLARLMVGRDVELARRTPTPSRTFGEHALMVRDLVVENEFGVTCVDGVSFSVGVGEIVGLAGVAGNGQKELAEAIGGIRTPSAGNIEIASRQVKLGDPNSVLEAGLAFVPEERMGVGLAPGMSVADNVALRQHESDRGGWLVDGKANDRRTAKLLEAFNVKGKADTLVAQLSGGNAQKVLLGRELSLEPKALVVAAPTRGLDVAATSSVRQMLLEAVSEGLGVLMISEDLEELMDLADRLIVMCGGRVTGIVDANDADVSEIGLLMMGHTEPELEAA